MEFCPDLKAQPSLEAKLAQNGFARGARYAVVHAGGNWTLKRWPVLHFAQTIRFFLKEFGFPVVLCGTASEEGIASEIRSHFPEGGVISLCGKTSLDELALLLKNAEFLLSNDSGPLHLAATQKTKILGLFGPTLPELTGPVSLGPVRVLRKDVGCEVPCYYRDCNYRVCMDWLDPQEVLDAAKELAHA